MSAAMDVAVVALVGLDDGIDDHPGSLRRRPVVEIGQRLPILEHPRQDRKIIPQRRTKQLRILKLAPGLLTPAR